MYRELDNNKLLLSAKFVKQKQYWLDKLAGALEEMDTSTLLPQSPGVPFKTPSPAAAVGAGQETLEPCSVEIPLSDSSCQSLIKLARGSDISLYIILTALLKLLIATYTGKEDIYIKSPVYTQNAARDTLNTFLVIAAGVTPGLSFKELILSVKQSLLDAYQNQDYPMDILFQSLTGSAPASSRENVSMPPIACILDTIHDVDPKSLFASDAASGSDLAFAFERQDQKLSAKIWFVSPPASTDGTTNFQHVIQRVARHYSVLLENALDHPGAALSDLSCLSPSETRQLLVQFNDTAVDYDRSLTFPALFQRQARQTPDRTALVCQDHHISYAFLDHLSNRLAFRLVQSGTASAEIIGLLTRPGLHMITGILGILKTGAAYLPIDPWWPQERITAIIRDSGLVCIAVGPGVTPPAGPVKTIPIAGTSALDNTTSSQIPTIDRCPAPHDLAYVIYTSGSTGKPKGVMIEHRNVNAYLNAFLDRFHITSDDVIVQQASYSFDAFVEEIYPLLVRGAKIVIPGHYQGKDAVELARMTHREGATILNCTPLLLNELNKGQSLDTVRIFISGGDVLKQDYVSRFLPRGGVYNTYGPTESTVCATYYHCPPTTASQSAVPIGTPIANYRVYILDKNGRLLPAGIPGEICIAGDGVARGYLNNPALSNEKFITPAPSSVIPEPYYRSGDLGCWLPDGNIQFLGRVDSQVKVRGYRIELGEIENTLSHYPEIRETTVIARDNSFGEKYICAYYTAETAVPVKQLRQFLGRSLPEYMIPAHFIHLRTLPVTFTGKVDIKALPLPHAAPSAADHQGALPASPLEKTLAAIWCDSLGIRTTGIEADFFEMGGDSLAANRVIARVRKELQVEVPLRTFFESPTIKGLAAEVSSRKKQITVIPKAPRDRDIPLSFSQERLWFLAQLNNRNLAYIVPRVLRVQGSVDVSLFERVFSEIIRRHEILRTVFQVKDGRPVQVVCPPFQMKIPLIDLSHLQGQPQQDKIKQVVLEEGRRTFDFQKGPLLRLNFIKLKDQEYLLMSAEHHLVHDGWTQGVLMREFITLYQAYSQGKPSPLADLPIQYADYASWQRQYMQGDVLRYHQDYWVQKLQDVPAVTELPQDRPRPAEISGSGAIIQFLLPAALHKDLKEFSRAHDATLFMTMLATFKTMLLRYSGKGDITIGTGIANRKYKEMEGMLGMVINTLALRTILSPDMPFNRCLEAVKTTCLEGYEHEDTPFEKVVEAVQPQRSLSYNPIFQVLYSFMDTPTRQLHLPGLELTVEESHNRSSKFDINIVVILPEDGGDGDILIDWEYNTDLFDAATTQRLIRHYKTLLARVVHHAHTPLAQLPMLDDDEKQRLLYHFNDTRVHYPADKTIQQWFEEQVQRTPQQPALTGSTLLPQSASQHPLTRRSLTYSQLNEEANHLTLCLSARGIGPGDIVGLMAERSVEMLIAQLAIIKAGAIYLPIGAEYPEDRVRYMLQDSCSKLLIHGGDTIHIPGIPTLDLASLNRNSYSQTHSQTDSNPETCTRSGDLLYVIYTSGTTGRPKGIMIQNRSMVNFITGLTRIIPFTPGDSILSLTTVSFDIYGLESLLPLCKGSRVVMGTAAEQVDPVLAAQTMQDEHITIFQATPSRLQLWLMAGAPARSLKLLKSLLVGGEAFPQVLLDRIRTLTHARIYNVYGPAETTIWSTVKDLTGDVPLDIGKPIANTYIYILGPASVLQPVGAAGELCISGDGVARGYINRPHLTAQKFIPDPWQKDCRIYRTGDLAKWLPDGNIQFLGRKDFQVKIRGFRIELPEIEKQLQAHPHIEDAVTIVKDNAGDKFLCAYVVPLAGQTIDTAEIRQYLSQELPDYMIPAYFVSLDTLPLNPNGKVDRKRLPEPELQIDGDYLEPQTPTEKTLVTIWADILNIDPLKIGSNANFFALGGHSLKASLVISRIHKDLHVTVPLAQMFKTQTVQGLAQCIDCLEEDRFQSIRPVEKSDSYRLSSAQKRLYILQQMELKNTGYNVSGTIYFNESPDMGKLNRTFRALIHRHESLRTSFKRVAGEPRQIIHDSSDIQFEIQQFKASSEEEIDRITAAFVRPFDLRCAPLLRAGLIRTPRLHILLVDMHHIICDGVSQRLLQVEFNQIYSGAQLQSLNLHYKDYAAWQNQSGLQDKMKTQEKYWLAQFSDSSSLPVIDLPADFPRPPVQSFQGNIIGFALTPGESQIIRTLARQTGSTIFMVILAMYNILLSKLSGQEDVIIGTAIAARRHQDLQNIVGMFANTLALRNFPAAEKTVTQFLEEVKDRCLDAFENQEYQFEELVEQLSIKRNLNRHLNRNPLFDIGFTVFEPDEFVGQRFDLQDEDVHEYKKGVSKFDLTLLVQDTGENYRFNFEYCTALFSAQTIERFIAYFKTVIAWVGEHTDQKIAALQIITPQERDRVLFDFNHTAVDYPSDKTVHRLFEMQVRDKPHHIALVHHDRHITYRQLNKNVNRLAHRLRARGVGPDSIVALMAQRSIPMITGALAVLKAGGAFAPIDAASPRERIVALLDDCNASILLTDTPSIQAHSLPIVRADDDLMVTPAPTAVRPQILDLDHLPIPDRSLVNYEKYNHFIGEAMVKNSMSIQATRGCPYLCAYCHKIWPKKHVYRSAEHIFQEVHRYYQMGVRRFAFIDDIFNLNKKNSSAFFRKVLDNRLDIHIFFPNGVRGDILTEEYMDLMVAAGTRSMAFALETASPRLQKLIGKNLDLPRFKHNIQYMCSQHPQVMLEMFTMHGFPSETEVEAMMTLDFIKSLKWVDIPYVLILKIYPNTDMERLALNNGVSADAIRRSQNFAYHELPDTLPFDKAFTRKYQSDFFDNYFLKKERLLEVLPRQMKLFTPDEIVKKYNNFMPYRVADFDSLLNFFNISRQDLQVDRPMTEETMFVPDLNLKLNAAFPAHTPGPGALNLLLLDLSQVFKKDDPSFDFMMEPPLGPMYLLTYLNDKLGAKINGKIAKPGIEFHDYEGLIQLLDQFQPHLIGIRTLTNTKDFFHRTVSIIKQWQPGIPIVAGGPYATSGYMSLLHDKNIGLVVLGEGEVTFCEFVQQFIQNGNRLPSEKVLTTIPGIAFVPEREKQNTAKHFGRDMILLDQLPTGPAGSFEQNPEPVNTSRDLAYAMFTSGSTGRPKAVLVEHRNIVRLVKNTNFVDFKEDQYILQTAPLEFDASTFEIWGPLLNGLRLSLTSRQEILDPESFKNLISRLSITTMWMTAPLFNQMFDIDPSIFAGLQHIIIGGDILSPAHIDKLRELYPKLAVTNGYGPTENTTFSTTYPIQKRHDSAIPIGAPIANSSTYILDSQFNPVPPGVAGELFTGGHGVSRGYMNNPELTRQRYLPNPWVTGDTLYRTGDNARWLPDGNIEFLGRLDQQVKIRGIRIELEEIEHRLAALNDIMEAVVLARDDNTGQKAIYAYFVSAKHTLDPRHLKQDLSEVLPAYMIPTHFVQLDQIPLTPNGKVDKAALPNPEVISGDFFMLPSTPVEEKLVDIWASVLDVDKKTVGIRSNFFDLGGQSLKATILVSRIKKEMRVKVALVDVFETQTIEELASIIEKSPDYTPGQPTSPLPYPAIPQASARDYYELSPAQMRLYVMHRMNTANNLYNIPVIFTMAAEPDIDKLAHTFNRLIQRHESFRTSFQTIDETPVQIIHDDASFEIELYQANPPGPEDTDLNTDVNSNVDSDINSDIDGDLPANLRPLIKNFVRPFDLSRAPLLRVGLISAGLTHILMLDMHHIIADGGCYAILQKEFLALYQDQELPEIKRQYKDYIEWLNTPAQQEQIARQKQYWLDIYSHSVPVLDLPTDFPRPGVPGLEGHTVTFDLSPQHTRAIKEQITTQDVTPFMYFLTLFTLWLSKLSGQDDIVVGSAASGRDHPELQPIIGMFVNMLAIRSYPKDSKTFTGYLKEVKDAVLNGFQNQGCPFEDLVEQVVSDRDTSRRPLFDVVFAMQDTPSSHSSQNPLNMHHLPYKENISKYDLTMVASHQNDKISFQVEYSTQLFKQETIHRFIGHFNDIVDTVLQDNQCQLQDIKIAHDLEDSNSGTFEADLAFLEME